MDKLSQAQSELREMDALAAEDSPVHRLHPLCKLLVTVCYIAAVVSFPKYDFTGLAVMVLYPAVLFQAAGIPVRTCFYKLRIVLPLVFAVGLVNPFLDRTPMLQLGMVTITGGVISMVTLMMKGVFSLMASFLLIATTTIDSLCAALRKLHVPSILTTLLLLTWDRAQELFGSMLLRGFQGEFFYADVPPCKPSGIVYTIACAGAFLLARLVPIASVLGGLFVG